MITSSVLFNLNEEYKKNIVCLGFSNEEAEIFLSYLKKYIVPSLKPDFNNRAEQMLDKWGIPDDLRLQVKSALYRFCFSNEQLQTIESKTFRHLANVCIHMVISTILKAISDIEDDEEEETK